MQEHIRQCNGEVCHNSRKQPWLHLTMLVSIVLSLDICCLMFCDEIIWATPHCIMKSLSVFRRYLPREKCDPNFVNWLWKEMNVIIIKDKHASAPCSTYQNCLAMFFFTLILYPSTVAICFWDNSKPACRHTPLELQYITQTTLVVYKALIVRRNLLLLPVRRRQMIVLFDS